VAEQNTGEKTEKATPKKLRDARKKGDIAKSKDLTNTVLLLCSALVLWQFGAYGVSVITQLLAETIEQLHAPFDSSLKSAGLSAVKTLLGVSAILLVPIAFIGLLTEFLQTGPVLTMEKVKPKLSHINPVEGMKKIFSVNSLFELFKSIVKTLVIFFLGFLLVSQLLPDYLKLPQSDPLTTGHTINYTIDQFLKYIFVAFGLIALIDIVYQNHSFEKKMKMSVQDVRREQKDIEGDPLIKSQRKQLGEEWAQQSATQSAKEATVLIVNPTHVAIAIRYDKTDFPVPTVTARGEDHIAKSMREAAVEAQIPVLRNISLARKLLADTNTGDFIPKELFDILAEIILWATQVRKKIASNKDVATPKLPSGGEDLTHYPPARQTPRN